MKNPSDLAIENKTSTLVVTVLVLVGGLVAYEELGRLEDPEFTIKDAQVRTRYPGATAREVEEEVTDVVETAIQQLGQVDYIESLSIPGSSIITVTIKDQFDKHTLPQVWDELRRKVGDVQGGLPPGAGTSIVNDDFGDVFGVFIALTGDGFSYAELEDYAKMLQRELLLVEDVAKVVFQGARQEVIYVEMARAEMAQLGVSERQIYSALRGKNLVRPSGEVEAGRDWIRIRPTGELDTVQEIGNTLIDSRFSEGTLYLRDVTRIFRGFDDPPPSIMHFNGAQAIGLGISTVPGGNVVTMGAAVKERWLELEEETPIGIEAGLMYDQPALVAGAVGSFVISLAEAVAIVVGVLLLTMGLRSGILIGVILLLTILATLMCMNANGIAMERISLGALIIALGMLVDNAIVITEGILIGIEQGKERIAVARDVVGKTMWPLFGATIVAILAFAGIGLSDDATGEFCRSLFLVILYSLGLSWVFGVTVTPLYCVMFLKSSKKEGEESEDPYAGTAYRLYRTFLGVCIRNKWLTILAMVVLFIFSLQAFRFVDQSFFPDSTTPQFTVDYWTTEGTDIRVTEQDMSQIEEYVLGQEGVESVGTFIGGGALRFMLTYTPEDPNTAFSQMIVTVDSFERMSELMPVIEEHIHETFPDSMCFAKPYVIGPGGGSDIEARITGPDYSMLRRLSEQVKDLMRADPDSRDVRDNWRERVNVLRPVLAEPAATNAGISRSDVADALQRNFGGMTVGIYRESDELLPIIARAPEDERDDFDNIQDMRIWSPVAQRYIPLRQVITTFEPTWEDNIIGRRDRMPMIEPQCNADEGPSSRVFARLRPQIEAMELPPGYELEWGGEYEDATRAQTALAGQLPPILVLMVLVVIFLFNDLRQPAIIWLTVPLAMIGVTIGLLSFQQSFGFMAILGLLSLVGMLIKNAVVLIDEIDIQIREGKDRLDAVMDSSVSRLRPVSMAALTTVLGMIPLLPDVFFVSMAVTIMAGLTFATVLTLLFVPVLYVTFFKIPTVPAAAPA